MRERLEGAAAGSLNRAGDENKRKSGGDAAREACDGEYDDGENKEAFASETLGKPIAGGKKDGVGDEING